MSGCLTASDSRARRAWNRIATAAVLALTALAYGAPAAAASTAPEIRIEPTTLYFGAATPPAAAAASQIQAGAAPSSRPDVPRELREKAASGGARVLVRLATSFTPEGHLASAQAAGQRQAISRAQDAALRKLEGTKARVHARYQHIPFLALEVNAAALDRLASLPEVAGIEEDVLHRPSLASSTAVIGAGSAWASGLTGAGQVIAVLDTGVDKTHPFFSSGGHNKVVSEACYSSTVNDPYSGGTTSLCPGGAEESTAPGSGVNCSLSLDSDCRHGTHVAGIAAGNDGVGPNFGVARDADLIAIQVFSEYLYYGIGAWTSDVIKGLERVYALADQFDIAAVNLSLGGYPYGSQASCDADNAATKAAIDNLRSIDIATVAAAGNDYYYYGADAPACISSAISVGATADNDSMAEFSNVAPFLSLVAPGVSVDSSVPGGGTANFNGTSMSSPHVAGAWAVLKQAHPSATVPDVLEILRDTAVPVNAYGTNLRRINLGRAVVSGPLVTQEFVVHNDGNAVLSVLSLQLETLVPWIRWSPEAPFDVPPGGSRQVTVSVDIGDAPAGTSMNRLIVSSNDADENPYPDAVHLVIGKEACYPLTRTRTGNGSYPEPSPSTSPGCPAGQFYAGAGIQLTAHPATGWALQSWSGTNDDTSTAVTNTLTMPAAPRTVSVAYFAPCFALTRTHTGSGSDPVASPANSPGCPAGQYKYAEPIQLTAAPAQGWRVGSWTNTSKDASRGLTNSLTMPASAVTVTVNYLEGIPGVLVVDASFGSGSISSYTQAVAAAGWIYDVWNVATDGDPTVSTLAAYRRVVWYPGAYDGPNSSQESALAAYLDGGGSLFLCASEYIFNRGFTPFIQNYLGVGSYNQDLNYYTVTGQGEAFGGLGPYTMSFTAFNDGLSPAPGAAVAFGWQGTILTGFGNAGVSKIGPTYRTIFLGFPFEALPTPEARRDVMNAALDFLGTVFADVSRGHWAKKWIDAMYRNGITSGCGLNPRIYCPEALMTRDQMAVFLLLAKEGAAYTPPPCTTAPFSDVPVSSPFCPWIQELAQRGVTSGCGGGNYCPQTVVSRAQMAVFLLSTLEGPGYAPPGCLTSTPFADVPASSPFCPWIKELANRGITGGCGGGNFCPGNAVNRAQMAVFLVTNFHLPVF
ncbi:MAG TPA: S8 family serine peptidase [Thermoanaerobaculia bacterium]|jgi:subtilisin family serine protease